MAAMSDMQPILMKKSTVLGFAAEMTIDEGVREALHTLRTCIILNPQDEKYTNARFIVQ
jgi:hypothetical protein